MLNITAVTSFAGFTVRSFTMFAALIVGFVLLPTAVSMQTHDSVETKKNIVFSKNSVNAGKYSILPFSVLHPFAGFKDSLYAGSIFGNLPMMMPTNGKIVFYTNRDGNNEIYTVNADGTSFTRLTNNTATDSEPDWSTDGSKIVFGSNRDGNYEIYVMNADGTNQTRLTNVAGIDYDPSFSPDNSRITFISNRDGNYEVYAMNADSTNLSRLTNNSVFEYSPVFSPDGTKIAFNSLRDGNSEIYVMNADGTNQIRLTNNVASDDAPWWSPDGSKITFARADDIWVMNANGSNQQKIYDTTNAAAHPAYSPDGLKIVFTLRYSSSESDLHIMNADGSAVMQLTNIPAVDEHAAWQPVSSIPYLSVNDVTIAEPTSGTTTATFTVSLSQATTNAVFVNVETADNTAVSPDDYVAVPITQLMFNSGETSKQVQVTINSDVIVEQNETYFVNLSNATNATIADNQGIGTIRTQFNNNGKIVFTTQRDGNPEVYVMNADGTSPTNRSNHSGNDYDATFSPDGSKIIFTSSRVAGVTDEIWVMNADGTNPMRVTNNSVYDSTPSYSPDGTKILFYRNVAGNNGEIFLMNADGTGEVNLTNNSVTDVLPKWSPDGNRIVFRSNRDGNDEIYTMNPNGSNVVRLTNNNVYDSDPAFSPDGSKIVFRSDRSGNGEIWTMNADGGNPVNLSNNPAVEGSCSWSADGSKILFVSTRNGNSEIYAMNADGSVQTRLTNNNATDDSPAGQPVANILSLSVNDVTIAEPTSGTTTAIFNVSLSIPSAQTVTVDAATANNTAIAPGDFTALQTTQLSFAPGETAKQVQITINSDALVEADETFFVNLSNAANAAIADTQGIGTIVSNNCAAPPANLAAWYRAENNANDSADTNHGSLQNGTDFGAGKVMQAFSLDGVNDFISIPDSPSVDITGALSISGWINPRNLQSNKSFVTKFSSYNNDVSFFFGTYNPDGSRIRFDVYQTGDAIVRRGIVTDAPALRANVWQHIAATFNPADQTMKIYVNGAEVSSVLIPGETSTVTSIYNSAVPLLIGAHIAGSGTADGFFNGYIDEAQIYNRALSASEIQSIYNAGSNGVCPLPVSVQFASANFNVNETANSATITVTRTGGTSNAVSVNYSTGNGSATAGSDYTTASGTLNFASGETSKTFSVPILDDNIYEGNEIVNLMLTNATGGAVIGTPSAATLTITDNEAQPTISINDVTVAEPTSAMATATFTVSLSAASAQTVTVDIATADNTATAPADYAPLAPTSVTFSPGETSKLVLVPVNSDAVAELAETFTVNLSNATNATITDAQGVGTIRSQFTNNGKIAFTSLRDGNREIYAMNPDGSSQTRLTDNSAVDDTPAFSPDGSRIAFATTRDGNYEIYVMNQNGSTPVRLTNNAGADTFPEFSADGTKIAFISARDGNDEIYVMNADGTNQQRLTSNSVADQYPAFSPVGSQILFTSLRDGNREIYRMNLDGSNQTRLTNNAAVEDHPVFSPDGSQIVFSSTRDGNYEIYRMNADGAAQTRLTNNAAPDTFPEFSPDGSNIAFISDRDGNLEIYRMNADGTAQTRLTTVVQVDEYPTWQKLSSQNPILYVNDVTITEPTSGTATASFNVTLSPAASGTVTVDVATANGTASAPDDYAALATTQISFAPGETSKQVQIAVNADTLVEANETFFVNLSNAANAVIADNQGVGTIVSSNCAPPPSDLVAWYKAENNANDSAGTNNGTLQNGAAFTTGKVGQAFSLDGINDYVSASSSGSLNTEVGQGWTVAAWVRPTTLTAQMAIVHKGNSNGAEAGANHWEFVVRGDVPNAPIEFVVVNAGVDQVRSTSGLTTGQWQHVAVAVSSIGGVGTGYTFYINGVEAGRSVITDQSPASITTTEPLRLGALLQNPGGLSGFFNGLIDETQIYSRALSAAEVQTIANAGSVGTCPLPSSVQFSAANYNVAENGVQSIVTVTRTGNTQSAVAVNYAATGGTATAGADFAAASGTLNFGVGETSKTFTVSILDDTIFEGSEIVNLVLSSPTGGATIGSPATSTITINDNEAQPTISINDVLVAEPTSGTATANFTVSLSHSSYQTVTVNAATANNTAIAPGDYAAVAATGLSFAPGEMTKQFQVTINSDNAAEVLETFFVNLSSATNATITDNQGIGAIRQQVSNGKIAFASDRDGNYEIYTMNADGSNQTNVSINAAYDDHPAFSPDGAKIAFLSCRNSNCDIYVMNADGSSQIRLTTVASDDTKPSWSPDGTKIVFHSTRTGGGDIYVMNADGTIQTRLTTDNALDSTPKFSPDGSRIVFESSRGTGGNDEIYVMNADGSNQTNISNNAAFDNHPAWSPNGEKIVFYSTRTGNFEIFVMNADGSNAVNLSNNSATDVLPAWSPDGTKIAFATHRDSSREIYTMNADGTNQTRLTNNAAYDYYPAWQPVGAMSDSFQFSAATYSVNEGGTVFFTITRTGDTSGEAAVTCTSSDGTATDGSDYYGVGFVTLHFAANQTSRSCGISTLDDAIFEGNETVNLALINPTNGATLGTQSTAVLTIIDNETPTYSIGGRIFDEDGTTALSGIAVNLSNGANTTTNAAGGYSFANLAFGANYTVTPQTTAVYSFAAHTVTNLQSNQTVNFTATRIQPCNVLSFSNAPDISFGDLPYSMATGDFNGDGKQDFAIGNYVSNTVSIRLGDGTGGFTLANNISVNNNPRSLAVGDFNNDNKLDFVTANYGSNTASIRLGDGTGNFTGTTEVNVGLNPGSIATGDFNGDGKLDFVIVGNSGFASIRLGDGTGGFTAATNVSGGSTFASVVVVADFNNDGKQDLAVSNSSTNAVSISLGNGNGTFTSTTSISVGISPRDLALGDFNNDGKQDFAAGNGEGTNIVSIRLGDGAGGFTAAADITNIGNFGEITIADLNNDGKQDLAIVGTNNNGFSNTGNVSIKLGDGTGGFTGTVQVIVGPYSNSIVVGDFNNDNKTDFAAASSEFGSLSVRLGNGNGTFSGTANTSLGNHPEFVRIADFNNDGKQDLATVLYGSDTVSIKLGNGDGTFTGTTNIAVNTNPTSIAIGDFNNDNNLDFATANYNSNPGSVSIRLGDGTGNFTNKPNVNIGVYPTSIEIGDFNNDNKLDFAAANGGSGTVSIRLGDGAGNFTGTDNIVVGNFPSSLAVSDFNSDGKLDFVTANTNSNTASIRLGDGAGTFPGTTEVNVGSSPVSIAIGDFNGDGKPDFATANRHSTYASIRLGNGTGVFTDAPNVNVGNSGNESIAISDFNSDNKLDLAITQVAFNSVLIRLGNGTGGFTGTTSVGTGLRPDSIAIGDFNGDGKQDFATANYNASTASIRLNSCGNAPPTVTMSSTASYPTSTSPIPVTVAFSESVTGFTASDVTSNGNISNFAGSGSNYSFNLIPFGPGLVTADIPANVALDSAGVGNTAAAQFSRNFQCAYTLNPTSNTVAAVASTSNSIGVTTSNGCTWTATTADNWLSVTSGATGNGNGTVGYSVQPNTGAARSGTITIAGQIFTVNQAAFISYEADVASRPNGDGSIASNDVVQMLRFLNELDPFDSSTNEFQRADSAPLATRGDGIISSADIIQTVRYLNELDGAQSAGGQTAPTGGKPSSLAESVVSGKSAANQFGKVSTPQVAPELRVENASGSAGNPVTVNIRVDAVGNESQYAFAVLFDPAVLTFSSFAAGETGAADFSCNTTATPGRVRCSVGAFPNNNPMSNNATIKEINAGNNQLLIKVIFNVAANAMANSTTAISIGSQTAADDLAASIIPAATGGTVSITGTTAAGVSASGRVLTQAGRGIRNVVVMMTDAQGNIRRMTTTSFGYFQFKDVAAGESYIFQVKAKRYQFSQPTQVRSIGGDIDDVIFVADDF